MLCAIITDPFALGDTETLLSAIRALQATITQAWARMSGWQNEMLKSSVVCWLHVEEDTISEATHVTQKELVRRELINTATIVAAVLKARGGSLTDLTAPLVSKHPSLAGLFNHAS